MNKVILLEKVIVRLHSFSDDLLKDHLSPQLKGSDTQQCLKLHTKRPYGFKNCGRLIDMTNKIAYRGASTSPGINVVLRLAENYVNYKNLYECLHTC